jgi:hypothetical protein
MMDQDELVRAQVDAFVAAASSQLRRIAAAAELRLQDVSARIAYLEATARWGETRLPASDFTDPPAGDAATIAGSSVVAPVPSASEPPHRVPRREHPTYARFFMMLRVGVPEEAVKRRMASDGVDPAALDAPEEPLAVAASPGDVEAPLL